MSYIEDWSKVPDGSRVIEDTSAYLVRPLYEVYEVFSKSDGTRWLRQIGFSSNEIPIIDFYRMLINPWIIIG